MAESKHCFYILLFLVPDIIETYSSSDAKGVGISNIDRESHGDLLAERINSEEHLEELKTMIKDTKEKLKNGAMANTLNTTEICNYKQQLIKLIEEMYSIQHARVQKHKDSKPKEHSENFDPTRMEIVQDLLAENIESTLLNENVSNPTKEKGETNNFLKSDLKVRGNDYNDKWNYFTTSGHLYVQTENLKDLEELYDTREVDKESKYIHGSYDKVRSKQKIYNQQTVEETILNDDEIHPAAIEEKTNGSQTTRSNLLSKLKKILQSLEHLFHINLKDKDTQQNYDENDRDSNADYNMELTESSKRGCEENQSTRNKQDTSKSYVYNTTCRTTSNNSNEQKKHIIRKHKIEDISDIKDLNNNALILTNDHKYTGKRLNMILNDKYKRKYTNDLNIPYQIHQEIESLANDTPNKNVNVDNPKTYKYERVLSNLDKSSTSSENYYTSDNDDYLLEEVDDKFMDYHDDAIDCETARKLISNHDKEIQSEDKERTAFARKDLFKKNHGSGNSKVHKMSAKKGINTRRLTQNMKHEVSDKSTLKTQLSTGVVLLLNSKPLLRKTRTGGASRPPNETVAAIGLSILCLATFLSILAAVLLVTKFLVNNSQDKNKFAFFAT